MSSVPYSHMMSTSNYQQPPQQYVAIPSWPGSVKEFTLPPGFTRAELCAGWISEACRTTPCDKGRMTRIHTRRVWELRTSVPTIEKPKLWWQERHWFARWYGIFGVNMICHSHPGSMISIKCQTRASSLDLIVLIRGWKPSNMRRLGSIAESKHSDLVLSYENYVR